MANAEPWKLVQKRGKQRVFELSGWSAPFGRARDKPVVSDETVVRHSVTRYTGNPRSTVHVFGDHTEPWMLNGRFRDRALGEGGALDKAEALRVFVREAQEIEIHWGGFLYAEGVITKYVRGHESFAEIVWELEIEIIEQRSQDNPVVLRTFERPDVTTDRIIAALNDVEEAFGRKPSPFSTDVLVQLGSYIAVVTSAVGEVRAATDTMTSVKDATFGEIRKLTNSISTLRESLLNAKRLVESLRPEALRNAVDPSAEISLFAAQVGGETSIRQMLLDSAELDRQARISKARRTKTTYQAREGDTWESVSTQHYGTPARAPDIQDANDIDGGAPPQKGKQYSIPE